MTDNDRGAGFGYEAAQWMTAGLFQKTGDYVVYQADDRASIVFERLASRNPAAKAYTSYKVVRLGDPCPCSLQGASGLADMSPTQYGLSLKKKDIIRSGIMTMARRKITQTAWKAPGLASMKERPARIYPAT